jgi:hypothetical protein
MVPGAGRDDGKVRIHGVDECLCACRLASVRGTFNSGSRVFVRFQIPQQATELAA